MAGQNEADQIEGIAVIGMAGCFPGANSLAQFWQNLRDGRECLTKFTDEQLLAAGSDPSALEDPCYVKAGIVLEGVDLFDAEFFGMPPSEARMTDPQHRIFLECAWQAVEDAGYDPDRTRGRIGVFAGSGMNTYLLYNLASHPDLMKTWNVFQRLIASDKDFLATRVSYKLNLTGPSITIQTACSTSLVAVHLGCQSLLNGESDMVLAGGVTIHLPQVAGYCYENGSILSPDGHCRAFDARANGCAFSSGVGIVVLKRLADALTDGDSIRAVIKGSCINNDGAAKVGYTAPSVDRQAACIAEALALAGVAGDDISYVEAHGTGTQLGDPIEVAALTKAFRRTTQKKVFCAIGSLKTNVGHLDAAAGVAGLMKTILAMENRMLPPSLNFHEPNTNIDFESSPFFVNSTLSEWKGNGLPRRAGVSAFGIGGTNAHVVLQEAPVAKTSGPSRPHQLLVLSARTRSALETVTRNAVKFFKSHPDLNLADAAYTLQAGRKAFSYRRAIVCRDLEDAVSMLEGADSNRAATAYQDTREPRIAFMFPGGGAQYVGMGSELYRNEPIFREYVDRCSNILQFHLSLDIRQIIYPDDASAEEAGRRLNETSVALPALFVLEYALARLWMAWGVHPAVMVGHSSGEYVAACLAGVFSLEDALAIVAVRGRLMQSRPGGSMLAVQLPEEAVRSLIDNGELSLAAINGLSSCTVSGAEKAIEDFKERLSEKNVDYRPLHISVASHSSMMDPVLDAFADTLRRTRRNPPRIPFVSNVTGTWITPDEAMDADYWARHLRQTVRFSDDVRELSKDPNTVFLEVGPGNTLTSLVKRHLSESGHQMVVSSIRHPCEQESDVAFILNALARLWLTGVEVDWSGFYEKERRHRLRLPTYPFERQRYWVEPAEPPRGYSATEMGLSRKEENPLRPTDPEILHEGLASKDAELQSEYVAPHTDLEETLAAIWRRVLGFEKVGVNDNFFALGGDSLIATQLLSRLRTLFHMDLHPKSLFDAPTIRKLVMYMVAREARPGLTEKTAKLLKRIEGMSEKEVDRNLKERRNVIA